MSSSILDDVKKVLGLETSYTIFDPDVIFQINGVLGDLHQLGVGPDTGMAIEDNTVQWTDLLGDDPRLNNVKTYLHLAVKMQFDPPNVGYVLTSMEKMLEKAEWRITVAADEIRRPPESRDPDVLIPDWPFADGELVIDGGTG